MYGFNEILFVTAAYLIGSIPFGIIVAKLAGIGDLTTQGSGNIGATNVTRVGGKKLGAATFILDFLKGFIPATIYIYYFSADDVALACALAAVIGHVLPVFNRFKGGKGVATGFGAIMAISPIVCLISLLLWLACFKIIRISSVAALFSFGFMPFMFLIVTDKTNVMAFAIALSMIIFVRHLDNIKRLLDGKEKGF